MESSRDVICAGKRLGKLAPKRDSRTLKLAKYVIPSQVTKPRKSIDWALRVTKWPMLLNDSLGDCIIAAPLHMGQCWLSNTGRPTEVTDAEALEAYERICGYDPANPKTDNGGVLLDVLNAWRKDGIGGRKIDAFAAVSRSQTDLVKLAIDWFGGLNIGLNLPRIAQNQTLWSVVPGNPNSEAGSWGGHDVDIVGYNANSLFCITWAAVLEMTWRFFQIYCDEAYAVISQDWLNAQGSTPRGLKMAMLLDDLKAVSGG